MSQQSWFSINNAAEEEAEVMIYDAIGAYGISADSFVGDLRKVTAKTIRVRLNTPGGSVFDGTAIHNALKEHPAKVIAQVDGVAASAGSFIAMAGDEVRMADNAYMMIHNAAGGVMGGSEDMRRYADLLEKMNDTIAGMYEKKTGKARDHWRNLMSAETWFTAEEAKAEGLADAVYASTKKPKEAKANFDFTIYNKIPAPVKAMWGLTNQSATEPSPLGEPVPVAHPPKEPEMADANLTTVNTAQPPAAVTQDSAGELATLNAQVVQNYIDKGRAIGRLEGQREAEEKFKAIYAAAQGRPDIAANAFLAGQNAATVALIFDADNKARQEARAELLAKETEIARMHAQLATGGHPGVPVAPSIYDRSNAIPTGLDPEAQAKMEWDSDPLIRAQNTDQKKWTLFRVNQLKGGVRVLSR
jgi:ATP-dependent protease ClpP protease subunit